MIFQRSVQGARMVAFRKLKLFAETQAEARRQKDASMRIAYSLAVQSSDKNRSRNAMNTWLRFVRVRRLQRMQQAKERLATTMPQQTNRGRLAVAYRSLRMFHEEGSRSAVRQQAAYNLIGRGASTQVQRVALNTWLKFAAERRAMCFRLQAAQALLAASRTGSIRLVYAKWRKLMETRKAQRQRRSRPR